MFIFVLYLLPIKGKTAKQQTDEVVMRARDVKNPGSNPVKWNASRTHTAYLLALLGATDRQIAEVMEVDIETINLWKRTKPEFLAELTRGKLGADTKVVEAFYKCATGYYYEEEVVVTYKGVSEVQTVRKYKPPDPWSCAKWLSLRQRGEWSETTKVEITNTNIDIKKFDFSGLSLDDMKVLYKVGLKQRQLNQHEESDGARG